MKLLFDENLSFKLCQSIADIFPESNHVRLLGLSKADDRDVWDYAKTNGFAIVSEDSDFAERSVLESNPPKIIWIRIGNCSTAEIEVLLRSANQMIRNFIENDKETCLLLTRGQ